MHAASGSPPSSICARSPTPRSQRAAARRSGCACCDITRPTRRCAGTDGTVRALIVASFDQGGGCLRAPCTRIDCDAVLMSVGWSAAAAAAVAGGRQRRVFAGAAAVPTGATAAGMFAAGRLNGVYDADRAADGGPRRLCSPPPTPVTGLGPRVKVARTLAAPRIPFRSSIIRRTRILSISTRTCRSRTWKDAAQEGFDSSELLKRYSTVGMAPSQGEHSNINALRGGARPPV